MSDMGASGVGQKCRKFCCAYPQLAGQGAAQLARVCVEVLTCGCHDCG